jgi:Uma2 family endonuclease
MAFKPFCLLCSTEPIQLAVEVVSTNWEDDYIDKLDEYQRLGIAEYWIVDYLAIGSRNYLGNPKVPTVFVYQLGAMGSTISLDTKVLTGLYLLPSQSWK